MPMINEENGSRGADAELDVDDRVQSVERDSESWDGAESIVDSGVRRRKADGRNWMEREIIMSNMVVDN